MQNEQNPISFLADDSGATAIEYGLIASLVCIVLLAGLRAFSVAMDGMYSSVTSTVDDAIARGA